MRGRDSDLAVMENPKNEETKTTKKSTVVEIIHRGKMIPAF
jgi:hypothetical protein